MVRTSILVRFFGLTFFGLSFSPLVEESQATPQEPVCIQVITCARDGKYYPNPCQAVEKGGGIAETNDICERDRKNAEG